MTDSTHPDDDPAKELAALHRSVACLTARIETLEGRSPDTMMRHADCAVAVAGSIGSRTKAAWRALRGGDGAGPSAANGDSALTQTGGGLLGAALLVAAVLFAAFGAVELMDTVF
ncbi:hypothetical protein [Roseicitreum antarcticum]|uniref:Uncharacterized protein n=1 Tax=Roseicitreum antarcticum TaxID=564137 RepID=A0A1H2Z1A8_9RHOB|nr:hypothetical protein [Roseicitreum antarcticum]SDX10788.1 hypothetical protein SAMN04488238_105201 [Roseicitreum antarcticum]